MPLAVHAKTRERLDQLRRDLPGSLLLHGKRGVGLATIAAELAGGMQTLWVRPTDREGNVDYAEGRIRIKQIRELYDQTRGKITDGLVVLLDDADRMQLPAQSAFLKLLEEPGAQVHFILLAHTPGALRATIRSRLQALHVQPIDDTQSAALVASLGVRDDTRVRQLLFIAGGLPAELTRLVNDEAYFRDEAALTADARDLLAATSYDKLRIIKRYQGDRERTVRLCGRIIDLARRTLSQHPQPALLHRLEQLLEIRDNIAAYQNIRLQLALFAL